MDQSEQQPTTSSIQVMPSSMFGNNQQMFLQSLQQQLNANGQQSIQICPIMQGGQGASYILQQQAPQPQLLQLPDGQTFLYQQPSTDHQQTQPQIININGNYYQIPAQQTLGSPQLQTQTTTALNQQAPHASISTLLPDPQAHQTTTSSSTSPAPEHSAPDTPSVESEEEPLYVNASEK